MQIDSQDAQRDAETSLRKAEVISNSPIVVLLAVDLAVADETGAGRLQHRLALATPQADGVPLFVDRRQVVAVVNVGAAAGARGGGGDGGGQADTAGAGTVRDMHVVGVEWRGWDSRTHIHSWGLKRDTVRASHCTQGREYF